MKTPSYEQLTCWLETSSSQMVLNQALSVEAMQQWKEWECVVNEMMENPSLGPLLKKSAPWLLGLVSKEDVFVALAQHVPPQRFVTPTEPRALENPIVSMLIHDNSQALSWVHEYMPLRRHWSGVHVSSSLLTVCFEHAAYHCLSFLLKQQKALTVFNTLALKTALPHLLKQGNDNASLLAELLRARYDELRKLPTDWANDITNMQWWERAVKPFDKLVEQIDVVFSPPSVYQSHATQTKLGFLLCRKDFWDNQPLLESCEKIFLHPDFDRLTFFKVFLKEFPFTGGDVSSSPQNKILSWWPKHELKDIFISNHHSWPKEFIPYRNNPVLNRIELWDVTSQKGQSNKKRVL